MKEIESSLLVAFVACFLAIGLAVTALFAVNGNQENDDKGNTYELLFELNEFAAIHTPSEVSTYVDWVNQYSGLSLVDSGPNRYSCEIEFETIDELAKILSNFHKVAQTILDDGFASENWKVEPDPNQVKDVLSIEQFALHQNV